MIPSGLVPHSGNIYGLLLALGLSGCSGWLLGQEGEVPGCSVVDTGFLPIDCAGGIAGTDGSPEKRGRLLLSACGPPILCFQSSISRRFLSVMMALSIRC
jgi:hypothetical protein